MTVKSLGVILIGIGLIIMFSMFAFSEWRVNLDFVQNIRYAVLFEWESDVSYKKESITLGQGLIFPLVLAGLGLALKYETIDSKYITNVLPFLRK